MKIIVFGSSGMLGGYLVKLLKFNYEVLPITRNEIDLNKDFDKIFEFCSFDSDDVIINASGIIKQRDYSLSELIRVNSLFPQILQNFNCKTIHITTDCVFSGNVGSYDENCYHDCLDDYGKSKSLGENNNLTIIRTSIIGEELKTQKSLLEWVKKHKNTSIDGYLNHFWNGVTCLELSEQILNIIQKELYWKGVRHYFSPDSVSKYQLVSHINDVYKLNNYVNPVMRNYCDRTLSSIYQCPVQKNIKEQIIELKKFKL